MNTDNAVYVVMYEDVPVAVKSTRESAFELARTLFIQRYPHRQINEQVDDTVLKLFVNSNPYAVISAIRRHVDNDQEAERAAATAVRGAWAERMTRS